MCLLVLLLAGIVPAPARSATERNGGQLDPELRSILRGNAPSNLAAVTPTADGATIDVIITAGHDISADLEALGGTVRTVLADALPVIITADIPLQALAALQQTPDLISAEAATPLTPMLDASLTETRVEDAWQVIHEGEALQGNGVIIAVVDSGIDYQHPTFQHADGTTRILEIWDQQASSGPPPPGYDYGMHCTHAAIEARSCIHRDTSGHGTHVASIAAGSGVQGRYRGVAPEADLLIVRNGTTAQTIDAWYYIVARASELNRPVVINNSFGTNLGPHDGNSATDQALERLSGNGVIFTVAVGNLATSATHAGGTIAATEVLTLPVTIPTTSELDVSAVDLWYSGDDAVSVAVTAPNGETYGPVLPGEVQEVLTGDVTLLIDAQSRGAHPDNGVFIKLQWPPGAYAYGNWSLTLQGQRIATDGRWDAWLLTSGVTESGTSEHFSGPYVDPTRTISQPATAYKAISVASYVTTPCQEVLQRQECSETAPPAGAISPFSSLGPTRDGRDKPELAAPGQYIMAALSRDASNAIFEHLISADGYHIPRQGTSMAAPHVAGTIALMLQMDPSLGPEDVIATLGSTARQDVFTGATWNAHWGMGKLDALAAVSAVKESLITLPNEVLPSPRPVLPCPTGQYAAYYFATMDTSGQPKGGECVPTIDYDWRTGTEPFAGLGFDAFSIRWQADFPLSSGTYAVRAHANDGVRIFVDDIMVLDGWRDVMSEALYTNVFRIEEDGLHRVRVEYYEKTGRASVAVQWQQLAEDEPLSDDDTNWKATLATLADTTTMPYALYMPHLQR